jgi:hypothetical protein
MQPTTPRRLMVSGASRRPSISVAHARSALSAGFGDQAEIFLV